MVVEKLKKYKSSSNENNPTTTTKITTNLKPYRIHIIVALVVLSLSAQAQQDIQLTQQHLSRININPASTQMSDFADPARADLQSVRFSTLSS
jgi:hypothetical protein